MNRFGLCSFPVRSQYREPESRWARCRRPGLESALARNEDRRRAASAVRRARARERESQQSAESRTEAGVGLVTRPSVRRTPGPHTNTSPSPLTNPQKRSLGSRITHRRQPHTHAQRAASPQRFTSP